MNEHMLDQHGLYDIYGMWHQPWWQRPEYKGALYALMLIIGSVGLALLIRMIVHWYRKRQLMRVLKPWEQALRDLRTITPARYHDRGPVFYGQMSVILKKYLHDRFAYAIINSTDWEAIAYLKAREVPAVEENNGITTAPIDTVIDMAIDILDTGYYVKFSGKTVSKHELERHFTMAVAIIEKTTPSAKSGTSKQHALK